MYAIRSYYAEKDNSGRNGNSKGRGRPRCWQCGAFGHISKDCNKWKEDQSAEPRKPQPQPNPGPTSGSAPMITHNVLHVGSDQNQSEEWLVDSGASIHLTNDLSLLQNVTIFAEPRTLQLATSVITSYSIHYTKLYDREVPCIFRW